MAKIKLSKGIISVTACLLVGFLSGFATQSSVKTWFPTLVKPFFNPPAWVFAPVWTVLYVLMGVSFAIIWSNEKSSSGENKRKAMFLFGMQLLLNALWSILFFGLCNPFLAFIEILLLWLLIFETIKAFGKIDSLASKLLYPYLAWVSFATVLNGSIWYLNH
ncbi:tryptophan-rich sensory protein [Flavobacterium amnicola]|uniref:Tryptophan-rich sensory protein n=1 Tax=Flavobacterium amnicola TaxID=2506422 RepID=A0A4Q1K746_9FLAO|nr:TspO/MBR family protein [Flavobacterium amnicola]RXR21295.1 tryptophan-rich sensory protein [Flavobacterium amnicola]